MNIASQFEWFDFRDEIDLLLKRALQITQAPQGNVQLADWRAGELFIAAQHGFDSRFLSFFRSVTLAGRSVCASAFRARELVVADDVMSDQQLSGCRGIFEQANVRAVQSTPLISDSGAFVGMISTHFPNVHRPTDIEMRAVGREARRGANSIIRIRAERRGLAKLLADSAIALREGRGALESANGLLAKSSALVKRLP
jgi:GAF domain-containing protein